MLFLGLTATLIVTAGRGDGNERDSTYVGEVRDARVSERGALVEGDVLPDVHRETTAEPTAEPEPTATMEPVDDPSPVPTAVPPPAPVRAQAAGEIAAIICSVPWPCDQAIRVARCESSLNPGAISPDGANYGLMQVNVVHRARVGGDIARLLDAATNVLVAYDIYRDAGGWGPWSCKP